MAADGLRAGRYLIHNRVRSIERYYGGTALYLTYNPQNARLVVRPQNLYDQTWRIEHGPNARQLIALSDGGLYARATHDGEFVHVATTQCPWLLESTSDGHYIIWDAARNLCWEALTAPVPEDCLVVLRPFRASAYQYWKVEQVKERG